MRSPLTNFLPQQRNIHPHGYSSPTPWPSQTHQHPPQAAMHAYKEALTILLLANIIAGIQIVNLKLASASADTSFSSRLNLYS